MHQDWVLANMSLESLSKQASLHAMRPQQVQNQSSMARERGQRMHSTMKGGSSRDMR